MQAVVSFTAPQPVPSSGLDFVVSDFDRDGLQDIATSSIAIGLTAADFDGADGPDLAVVDGGTHRASILLNDGEGGFALHGPHHPTGTLPGEVAAGDFDDDGHLDLAVSRYWDDVVRILPGDGEGGFGAGVDVAASGPAGAHHAVRAPAPATSGCADADRQARVRPGQRGPCQGGANGSAAAGAPLTRRPGDA